MSNPLGLLKKYIISSIIFLLDFLTVLLISLLNPDCAVDTYCGLKIHAIPPRRDFTILVLDILVNMPAGQNRSNCAFRNGFLRLATMPTAQSGLKGDCACSKMQLKLYCSIYIRNNISTISGGILPGRPKSAMVHVRILAPPHHALRRKRVCKKIFPI